ncbi:homoserine O-acetyltransferase [soil metagenome]
MFEVDFTFNEPFQLESGEILPEVKLRANIYGQLNADRSNAVLVFHALTGSSRIGDWWNGLMCDGCALDTSEFAFVCVNYLGSSYGSTSASTLKKRRAKGGKGELPIVTLRDIVRTNVLLFDQLGITKFRAVIGGSVGGMLALQFAVDYPELTDHCVSIAATPLSAMGLALNHLQRHAIKQNDLELARKIAIVSYKSPRQFGDRFGRKHNRNGENPTNDREHRFDIGGYLDHQGDSFRERFEIESYDMITKAMDLFELSVDDIRRVKTRVSLVGISSDWLFPAAEVCDLAERFAGHGVEADYHEIDSEDGHDAFLSDVAGTSSVLRKILGTKIVEVPGHFFGQKHRAGEAVGFYK